MTEKELKKLSLLAEVACDYYERKLDQSEIAKRLCLSRTRVSRLLKEAADKGVVKITVNYRYSEYNRHYELEERSKLSPAGRGKSGCGVCDGALEKEYGHRHRLGNYSAGHR